MPGIVSGVHEDKLIIRLDTGGPVALSDLSSSLLGLSRYYDRHYGPASSTRYALELYVVGIASGSIVLELAPYMVLLGNIVEVLDAQLVVSEFAARLYNDIKAFSDIGSSGLQGQAADLAISREDMADIREFVRPLVANGHAGINSINISHAKPGGRKSGKRIAVEYKLNDVELSRAALNIDNGVFADHFLETDSPDALPEPAGDDAGANSILSEVMLFFEQANRKPGKEKGKTGDRAIIPDISDKAIPVYFRRSFQNLKQQMVAGRDNPLTNAFIVDVNVQKVGGEPKAYLVTNVHSVLPLEEGEARQRGE